MIFRRRSRKVRAPGIPRTPSAMPTLGMTQKPLYQPNNLPWGWVRGVTGVPGVDYHWCP